MYWFYGDFQKSLNKNICNAGRRTVWQDVGRHSFYGPWDISVKQNGDYIDYNDYGVHLEQFRPNSPELSYDDVSIANGYIDALPSAYDSGLSEHATQLCGPCWFPHWSSRCWLDRPNYR